MPATISTDGRPIYNRVGSAIDTSRAVRAGMASMRSDAATITAILVEADQDGRLFDLFAAMADVIGSFAWAAGQRDTDKGDAILRRVIAGSWWDEATRS